MEMIVSLHDVVILSMSNMHIRGWSCSLVSSLIPFRSQKSARSLPYTTLAFAALAVISSSICTAPESVFPGHVNLSAVFSF